MSVRLRARCPLTSVRQFVQFDARERLGPIRVIAHDVILDLVVGFEPEFAVWALTGSVGVPASAVSRLMVDA